MISLASCLFREFVGRYEDLYVSHHMICNLHYLFHISDVVKHLGPLWAISCSPFKGLNGLLKELIHGTRYVHLQITSTVMIFINITRGKLKVLIAGSKISSFCERLALSGKNRQKLTKILDDTSIIDKCTRIQNLPDKLVSSFRAYPTMDGVHKIYVFQRLVKNGIVYKSKLYSRK